MSWSMLDCEDEAGGTVQVLRRIGPRGKVPTTDRCTRRLFAQNLEIRPEYCRLL